MRAPFAFTLMFLVVVPAGASTFLDMEGFEDDVDLVVSPNGKFLVIPEEEESGATARLKIESLDPLTGECLGLLYDEPVLGYENGVDPLIITLIGADAEYLVLVPVESEGGGAAGIVQLVTDEDGNVVGRRDIDLGNLGFRPDVDGVWTTYPNAGAGIAFFVLETEDALVQGVVAIDADNSDCDWGSCRLLSTDGRDLCEESEVADWLLPLVYAVDPLAYEIVAGFANLLIPVASSTESDLLHLEYDTDIIAGNDQPPNFLSHQSIKERNALGARPLSFPGYEWDVDLVMIEPGVCGVARSILVPVEGPGDVADLYLIDQEGDAVWTFFDDSGSTVLLYGYEKGVDLVTLCGLPAAPFNRVVVPVENAAGTDADLFILNLETGAFIARVEGVNPGLTLPGYEIGVDPVRWTEFALAVPLEGSGGDPGVAVFLPNGTMTSSIFAPGFLGYMRSVGPIVAPLDPPALIVPIGLDDGSDTDVAVFTDPPVLGAGAYSLEAVNPGLTLKSLQWDVDLGVVNNHVSGQMHLYLAEETPDGSDARLRFENLGGPPGNPMLVIATDAGANPGSLHLADVATGFIALAWNDVLGLETGLDMANATGPVTPGEFPVFPLPTAVDRDGDPTMAWETASLGISERPEHEPRIRLRHPNPFPLHARIAVEREGDGPLDLTIVDSRGRLVRSLHDGLSPAAFSVSWDGRDAGGRPMPPGVYFVRARSRGFEAGTKLVFVR